MIIEAVASMFSPKYPKTLVYMLQSTEYRVGPYLRWYWRTNNFKRVAVRRDLATTRRAKLLLVSLSAGMILQILTGIALIVFSQESHINGGTALGIALLLSYPVVWAHLIVVPLLFGRWFVAAPQERKSVTLSHDVFSKHAAVKIAVAGSYGKTTMKELLLAILGESKKVAATPSNKNVAVSHGEFAKTLSGDEDVVIVEFGEAKPGDVKKFTATTKPNIGVITGLAPAHLDRYRTIEAAGKDIFTLADYLNDKNVYVNGDSAQLREFIKPGHTVYSAKGVDDWKIADIRIFNDHTEFSMKKGNSDYKLKSGLVGRHQIGPLAVAIAIAHRLGLSETQIQEAVAKTIPFEHRMQPRFLAGAWIIDDTYNGNIEGVRAGLALLKELPAKRKIYVTPGLVDQGEENERVHREIGQLIAQASPDKVVLMKNSVTRWIQEGLRTGKYTGVLSIEVDPLNFYNNLEHFVAAGDTVLMQNDWTDNYN